MTGHLLPRAALTPSQQQRMLTILSQNFSHITPVTFHADLAEKNWVILIRDGQEEIVGFSTIHLYTAKFEGRELAVIYSGDTIIEKGAWGSATLPRTWIHSVWKLHASECPHLPLYWLLLTGGFRTYRFLSVFWKHFYPNPHTPMPPHLQHFLQQLAADKFGPRFDANTGVVRLGQPLNETLLAVPEGKRADPHVAFFLQRNPGHAEGDELACLCELARENLTAAGWRMVNSPP